MEAVVLQALGDVDGLDAGRVVEGAHVEDELVGAAALGVGVEDGVVGLELGEDVVGVQDGDLGGLGQADGAHHLDVRPRDGQDGGAAPGRT